MRDAESGRDAVRRPLCAVFVSGTGTDVGKTVVTAALLRALRLAGVAAQAVKPVQTGVRAGENTRVSSRRAGVRGGCGRSAAPAGAGSGGGAALFFPACLAPSGCRA
ncbi:MAG: AAA family ATPase [Desulfovibrio fairfieldensis]